MNNKYIFHVHTFRCGHAGSEPDESYVRKAIEMGAETITFTDHAPFPGNPFTNRMKYEELDDYINSLTELKEKYKRDIEVHIGLEVEYMPSYLEYYKNLKNNKKIEILILGQHHYEIAPGKYSFNNESDTAEYVGLFEAMYEGINTGLFDVIAHPDRAFRRECLWTESMEAISERLINKAGSAGIILEKNYSSMQCGNLYREEFWRLVPQNASIIYGCDAHSTDELVVTEGGENIGHII